VPCLVLIFVLSPQIVLSFGMPRNFFLIAGHDALGKRNCYKQAISNVVVGCGGGGEAFYSPMIRSQSFSKPVHLDCEVHQCFSGFFLPP